MTYSFDNQEVAINDAIQNSYSAKTYVMCGTNADRNNTYIEVYTNPLDSTIVTGVMLGIFKNGKKLPL